MLNRLLKPSSWPPCLFPYSSSLGAQLHFSASFSAASYCTSHCLLHSQNRSTPHQTTLTLPNPFSSSSLAAQECSCVCIYVHPHRRQRCRGNLLRAGSGVNSFWLLVQEYSSETRFSSGWLHILLFSHAVIFKLLTSNSISHVYWLILSYISPALPFNMFGDHDRNEMAQIHEIMPCLIS